MADGDVDAKGGPMLTVGRAIILQSRAPMVEAREVAGDRGVSLGACLYIGVADGPAIAHT